MEQKKETQSTQKNIGMAIVAYIIFFIPLLTDAKNDSFVKYHVKQGLILFICAIILNIIYSILPLFFWWIGNILYLGLAILALIGIINAFKGEQTPLPLIGKWAEKFNF